MKNENLYTHLFNLRQLINEMMVCDNCWTLQYAVKMNIISNLNTFMGQLHYQEHLEPINIIFEDETVNHKPSLKEFLNLQNQIFYFSELLKGFSSFDSNLSIVSEFFEAMNNLVKKNSALYI